MITLVVFSKDRAMQLDSLLRSVKDHCTGIDWVTVIYQGSTDLHFDAYQKVASLDDVHLTMYPQHSVPIGAALLDAVADSDYVALAVDDMTFFEPSDFKKAAFSLGEHQGFVWSWRLGRPMSHQPCACPFDEADPHWLVSALYSDADYGYLWHSDGALYHTADYIAALDMFLPDWRTGAHTPNDLEAAVAGHKAKWAASVGPHLGPLAPTCITWQLNRVQTRYGSPAAEIPETNTDALARSYLDGKRVDNEKLYAALRENPLRFNPPGARPTHVYACEEASKFWAGCVR
jgi:hypothetical protein